MLDILNAAIDDYFVHWQALVAGRTNKTFFEVLKPTAVAWKTVDLQDFDTRFAGLRASCDQIHIGWVNDRWLATLHLKQPLSQGISIVKLMQRRPSSSDAVGLDHIDFYCPRLDKIMLQQEPNLHLSEESNGEHCQWLSVWFAGTEAKLRTDTVVQTCINELKDVRQ